MEEYKNFHRGTNLLTIPQLTWDLKAQTVPFSLNRIITIEERGQGGRTFKDCGSASKYDDKDTE